jgi:hypothetical protein
VLEGVGVMPQAGYFSVGVERPQVHFFIPETGSDGRWGRSDNYLTGNLIPSSHDRQHLKFIEVQLTDYPEKFQRTFFASPEF